jgi:hypothetical protein
VKLPRKSLHWFCLLNGFNTFPLGIGWMKRSAILLTRSGIFKTHTQGTPSGYSRLKHGGTRVSCLLWRRTKRASTRPRWSTVEFSSEGAQTTRPRCTTQRPSSKQREPILGLTVIHSGISSFFKKGARLPGLAVFHSGREYIPQRDADKTVKIWIS